MRIGGSDADTGQQFLDQVVGSVIRQYRSLGKSIVKEEAAEAVCQVLNKLECTVE